MKKTAATMPWAAGLVVAVLVAGLSACSTPETSSPAAARDGKPNILVIVADDLGYSDLGTFGGEIATPNLDALARTGRLLTNFHTAAVCSPTRASLLSGVDHHLAGLGNMAEVVGINITGNRPHTAPWGKSNTYDFDNIPAGYQGHLSPKALSMAEVLRDGGYSTFMVGKWHLAYQVAAPDEKVRTFYRIKPDALPHARGFERSFTLLNGGGSHYAPSSPPTPLDLTTYAEDARVFPAAQLPPDFFSTAAFTDKLIGYIDANRASGKPFFAYAAYTAPHWPLQAPEADIAAQKGRYDAGYEVIRDRRIERMKQLGLIPAAIKPHPGVASVAEGGQGPKRWSELSAQERAREARLMEIYAAMVSNLDAHIGRLIDHLKRAGDYDNTLILFMSDNGAEGAEAFAPLLPGTKVDNAFERLGRPGSVAAYGPRWAEVSAAPFRLFKGFTGAEGGTASPLIVKLPGQSRAAPLSHARLQVTDVLPTVLDAAGIANPGGQFRGGQVHPIEGRSFLDALRRPDAFVAVHPADAVLADELMGASYVVKGRWKLSQQADFSPGVALRERTPWRLYDLASDRGETRDLSADHPDIVNDLVKARADYARRTGLVEHRRIYSGR
jgi:arylsulfatase